MITAEETSAYALIQRVKGTPVKKVNTRTYVNELPSQLNPIDQATALSLMKETFGASIMMGDLFNRKYRGAGIMKKELPPLVFGMRKLFIVDHEEDNRRFSKTTYLAASVFMTNNDHLPELLEMFNDEDLPMPSLLVRANLSASLTWFLGQSEPAAIVKEIRNELAQATSTLLGWYSDNPFAVAVKIPKLTVYFATAIINPMLPESQVYTNNMRYGTKWLEEKFKKFNEDNRPKKHEQLTLF